MTSLFRRSNSNSNSQFIEDALLCTPPLGLSYPDPAQKWIIRRHLISLLQNCPYLKPTVRLFTHNDGTQVKLLAATGSLPLPLSPPVPLTIWIHEHYPCAPPIVIVHAPFPVYDNHPFVNPASGATTSSYLVNWDSTTSNPTELVRSLIKLFNHAHPFYHNHDHDHAPHYSSLTKMEAMDHLAAALFHDLRASTAANEAEIGRLTAVQGQLQRRAESVAVMEAGLKWERRMLEEKTKEVWSESDTISEWLKVHEKWNLDMDQVFEMSSERIHWEASVGAIEDLLYILDGAFGEGVLGVGLGDYLREVRKLAREQFKYKLHIRKIDGKPLFQDLPSSPSSSSSSSSSSFHSLFN